MAAHIIKLKQKVACKYTKKHVLVMFVSMSVKGKKGKGKVPFLPSVT